MIALRHMDVRHFVIIDCSHLVNGCTIKCGCISFDVVSLSIICLCAIIYYYNYYRICFSVCVQSWWHFGGKLCNRSLGVRETKWTSHVKRPCDVAQRYTSSVIMCYSYWVALPHLTCSHPWSRSPSLTSLAVARTTSFRRCPHQTSKVDAYHLFTWKKINFFK